MTNIRPLPEANIWELLENRAVLVTVNQRLARYLVGRFNRRQMDGGYSVWETPDILPYSTWLARTWEQARYSGMNLPDNRKTLLSPQQEQYLWEKVISDSKTGSSLLRVAETARAAMGAWEICRQWMLPVQDLKQAPGEDTMAYLSWADTFESLCRENNWLDSASLAGHVAGLLESGKIPAPSTIILAGFDELSPLQRSVVHALESRECAVFALEFNEKKSRVRRCELADTAAEIKAAAQWARERLAEHPEARIGIIAGTISALRPDLIRIFEDVFHPSMRLSPYSPGQRAFNLSMGRPLSDYPIIRTALLILTFASGPLDINDSSELLLSPFISGGDTETSRRAALDARIRENGETDLSLAALIHFSTEHKDKEFHPGVFCPVLSRRLANFRNAVHQLPFTQPPSGWATEIAGLLDAMGWSRGRPLSSEEKQTVDAFSETLRRLASLDTVCEALSIQGAVSLLVQDLKATTFQPETGEVPVQIMGALEAVGERFDHVWIMGMDGESWPLSPNPNPFLPVWLQKKYNVPHASPERELAYCRQITRRLLTSADQVMVSSPKTDGDTVLFPSPLIAHIEAVHVDVRETAWWRDILSTAELEQLPDAYGPSADARSHISGGTGLLKAQAACPFSAFAAYRLQAKIPEIPESGLNARERGSLIHNSLERFWKEVQSQKQLAGLPAGQLLTTIEKAVADAVAEMAKKHPRTFTARFTELERQRLVSLMQEFLAVDRKRSPFTVIGLEEKMVRTIAGIELKTYADRIDELDDGRLVIVDYKTGEPSVADWFTERLAEPQLPLYSVAVEKDVAGVAFARLKKGDVAYLGVADAPGIIPGTSTPGDKRSPMEDVSSLKPVISDWKGKIERLAEEVRQGLAAVSPVSVQKSCRYCDFGPMCRIGEVEFLKP